jgi:Ca-activated chloride channel homolog
MRSQTQLPRSACTEASSCRDRSSVFRALAFLTLFLLVCVSALPAPAQDSEAEVHIRPRIESRSHPPDMDIDPALKTHTRPLTSDVNLVLVPVTVTDPMDRLVTGLEKDNFEVFQDKKRQRIQTLSSEDAPISMGIIFDMSGSMKDKLAKAKEAVVQFMRTANPADEFFIIGFSNRPELLADFTDSIGDIQGKLITAAPTGMTALLDAIYLGMNEMKHAHHRRRAMLIISDGGDNHSRYTESEIKSAVEEADVQLYAIGIYDYAPQTPEERYGPTMLSDLTDVTGGRTFVLDNPNDLPDVAAKIGTQLRNQYVIAYAPDKKPTDGRWHKIRVKLTPPKGLPPLHIHAKTGYYATQE